MGACPIEITRTCDILLVLINLKQMSTNECAFFVALLEIF